MTNKVFKSDFNIKSDKDSENKEIEYSNITNNISDRGDSGKEAVKPDGLDNKDSINKENEKRKSIDVFIKQYLPDRGDSKRLFNKTNKITNKLNFKNKNRAAVDSDTEKNTNKIDDTQSDGDILVIPETGEKVCKTDIKLSYIIPTKVAVKGNETLSPRPDSKCKINHVYDNRIRYKLVKTSNEDESKQNISSTDSSKSANVKKSEIEGKRKPIIKTIKTKNDAKVYKAVTFVDDKDTTPLHVNIPEIKRRVSKIITESMKARVKNIVSKVSLKEKNVNRRDSRKRKQNKHVTSPEASIGKVSPPTEVAKWAPSCINEHTKPYYEAWVNTTLTAIARDGGNDELMLEKQRIIESFKRALEDRPKTPELVLLNEKYTGRITVRQR
ncbi:hypothetical protein K1T71_000734 [Dendrolimus kikuchii]|uniref:Uncharacterized protein n=1 Tax=Dendrolimus kikuchii TaxID=765133 RepID=A0ACC1DKF5_9NEOP|nr:hypothetical protein K1T71_000734 [Dendrolimus kikuchii]